MLKRASAMLAFAVLLAAPVRAQDPTGAIEGTITDKGSSGVAGARVVARNLETGPARDAVTAPDGFYRLTPLPVGAYRVTAEAPQFAKLVQEPVQVNVSQTVRVDLQVALPNVNESVTVTGAAQLLDASTNALGRVVTGREILELPLNGRNFTLLGLLQTGALCVRIRNSAIASTGSFNA